VSGNNKNNSLLFVSIDFPPARTSGIYRPVFFTKYLIESGWDVTLLTVSTHLSTVTDESLFAEIHPRLKVIRASAPMPRRITGTFYKKYEKAVAGDHLADSKPSIKSRFFSLVKKLLLSPAFRLIDNFILIPDNYIIWAVKNLPRAYRVIKRRRITHLLVTSPPHSVQVMGLVLSYLTGVRYIIDFRNSWTDNQPYRFKIRERFEKYMEKKILKRSRTVINMSSGDVDRLVARLPDIPPEKLFTVTNGYNEGDFADRPEDGGIDPNGPLRILYVGSMYPHSGDSTARALQMLAEKGYGPDEIEYTVIGFSDKSFDRLVETYNIGHLIKNNGFMNHDDLIRAYDRYDAMYLVTGGTPYYHVGALPGKIFEYMRVGKPILHTGIEGTTHDILEKSGLEIFVPLDDAEGTSSAIIDLMKEKKSGYLSAKPDLDFCRSFEWRQLAKRVNEIISAVD
jgi:glycosyltransferase involved in cell wall biosynthesis